MPGRPGGPPFDDAETVPFSRVEDELEPILEDRTNIRERTMFVGRERELSGVAEALVRGRCVTLIGTAGVGKTRLARRFGWLTREDYLGGVWFCDLSVARSLGDVLSVVARALGQTMPRSPSEQAAVDRLGGAIARRGRVLLILDNAEHLAEVVRDAVERWLACAPEAQILITSRAWLGLAAETAFVLHPLSESEAVQLFESHARALGWSERITPADRPTLVHIVRRLDGLPLAIVLAASRAQLLSPEQLRDRLAEGMAVLSGGQAEAPDRHHTMQAAVQWSWNLLSPWERQALSQCTVFRGGFSVESAEALVDLSSHAGAPTAMDVLQSLVARSLVRTDVDGGQVRLGLYECIREFAAAQLAVGERDALAARHAAYFAELGEQWAQAFEGARGAEALVWLAREEGNLMSALEHSLEPAPAFAARAAWALFRLVDSRGATDQHLALLEAAADAAARAGEITYQVRLLWGRGSLLAARGRFRAGRQDLETACELAAAVDATERARALSALGICSVWEGRTDDAEQAWQTALALYRRAGNRRLESIALNNLSMIRRNQCRLDEAQAYIDEALEISDQVGNAHERGHYFANRAGIDHERGELAAAHAGYRSALAVHREVGNHTQQARVLFLIGSLEHERGDLTSAHCRLTDAMLVAQQTPSCRHELVTLAHLAAVLAQLGREGEADDVAREAMRLAADEPENRVGRAVLDAMLAVMEQARGRAVDVAALLERIAPLAGSFAVVRCACRVLSATMAAGTISPDGRPAAATADGDPTLRVAPDGAWFSIGGTAVDLRRRRSLARILAELTHKRVNAPGEPTSMESLVAIGWPDERILPGSAASRVYMAVSTLRKMGLGELLMTVRDGYLLDPERPVARDRGSN